MPHPFSLQGIPSSVRQRLESQRRTVARRTTPSTTTRVRPPPTPPPPPPPASTRGPTPFSQTRAGVVFRAEQDRQSLAIQRQNAEALARQKQRDDLVIQAQDQKFIADQLDKRLADEAKIRAEERERTRQANISQLRVERQSEFSQLLSSGDQVRAVLFALGVGPENDTFDVRARALGTTIQELKGARQLGRTTALALREVLGRGVRITEEGVTNLGSAVGAAQAFQQGGVDVQQLLTSAFGVGSLREGGRPGISSARLGELIQSVTPTGVL